MSCPDYDPHGTIERIPGPTRDQVREAFLAFLAEPETPAGLVAEIRPVPGDGRPATFVVAMSDPGGLSIEADLTRALAEWQGKPPGRAMLDELRRLRDRLAGGAAMLGDWF